MLWEADGRRETASIADIAAMSVPQDSVDAVKATRACSNTNGLAIDHQPGSKAHRVGELSTCPAGLTYERWEISHSTHP